MTKPDLATLYDTDFFEWTQSSAELIRQGRLTEADLAHIAEEIEDMGKRDRREVRSRLIALIAHLLKWQFQPEQRGPSWRETIIEQRQQLNLAFQDSPSLIHMTTPELPLLYMRAVRRSISETELEADQFPSECPYSVQDILDPRFLPE